MYRPHTFKRLIVSSSLVNVGEDLTVFIFFSFTLVLLVFGSCRNIRNIKRCIYSLRTLLADLALFFGVGSSSSDSSDDKSLPTTCVNLVKRAKSRKRLSVTIGVVCWMTVGFGSGFCVSLGGFEGAAFFGEGDSFWKIKRIIWKWAERHLWEKNTCLLFLKTVDFCRWPCYIDNARLILLNIWRRYVFLEAISLHINVYN